MSGPRAADQFTSVQPFAACPHLRCAAPNTPFAWPASLARCATNNGRCSTYASCTNNKLSGKPPVCKCLVRARLRCLQAWADHAVLAACLRRHRDRASPRHATRLSRLAPTPISPASKATARSAQRRGDNTRMSASGHNTIQAGLDRPRGSAAMWPRARRLVRAATLITRMRTTLICTPLCLWRHDRCTRSAWACP